jgi:MarR family transcriptional regulator, transcriptional regulator for hemolysin
VEEIILSLSFFHLQLQFSRSYTKKLNEQLAEFDLYLSQWSIVYYLKHFGASTLVEISQYLNVEKPTVSRTVDRLQKSQMIEKVPSNDKRERKIQLSEKGNDVYSKAMKVVEVFEQELIDGISEVEREVTLRTIQTLGKKLN